MRLFFLVFILTLHAVFSYAQKTKTAAVDSFLSKSNQYHYFNGTALVAENGKVILKKGYGYANMEWDMLNSPDTRFRIGSITKQFTAMLILQLAEQGKINTDSNICTYLPWYPAATGKKIKIHHLLTHTSGIPNFTNVGVTPSLNVRDMHSPKDMILLFDTLALDFEPGTQYRYSNSGYCVLGAIIETLTGKPYATVLQERIFDPLGMKHTGYDLAATVIHKRAAGYTRAGGYYENASYIDMTVPFAAGGLYATVEDLYLWDQALYTTNLISAASRRQYFKPFLSDYAYGWAIKKVPAGNGKDSINLIMHTGGINGFSAVICRDTLRKNLVVLLDNTADPGLAIMAQKIMQILNGATIGMPKAPLFEKFHEIYDRDGMTAAGTFVIQNKDQKIYEADEGSFNMFGYELLYKKDFDRALAVFDLNVLLFPSSANAYDSRGEAYAGKGNKEKAIQDYKKSLALDPANANAEKMIKELQYSK